MEQGFKGLELDKLLEEWEVREKSRIERSKNGIPYHPEVIEWFESITSELEITLEW